MDGKEYYYGAWVTYLIGLFSGNWFIGGLLIALAFGLNRKYKELASIKGDTLFDTVTNWMLLIFIGFIVLYLILFVLYFMISPFFN